MRLLRKITDSAFALWGLSLYLWDRMRCRLGFHDTDYSPFPDGRYVLFCHRCEMTEIVDITE